MGGRVTSTKAQKLTGFTSTKVQKLRQPPQKEFPAGPDTRFFTRRFTRITTSTKAQKLARFASTKSTGTEDPPPPPFFPAGRDTCQGGL